MKNLTDYTIERAIRAQDDDTFDTHDICRTLMKDFPADFVRILYECLEGNKDPFPRLHTEVENVLGSSYLSHVVRAQGSTRRSVDCRGQEEECKVWERTF